MKRIVAIATVATVVVVAACSESSTPNGSALLLSASSAYTTVPAGFSDLNSSFSASATDDAFLPSFDGRGPGGPGGHSSFGRGPGLGIGFMGGLGGPFLGLGLLIDAFRIGSCSFSSSTGVTTCQNETRNGLTISRTFKYTDTNGNPQQKIDTTTNTIASTVSVVGSVTHRDSSKSDVNESSNQSVSGFAKGSKQLTINGASAGTETTTGTSSMGAFTAKRVAGDTISGVVLPFGSAALAHPPYPSAGTVTRSMSVTVTVSGQSPALSSRREVITYDGSATAKVVITEDGTTQNCTLPLPFGHLTCQ
jgi:hypothetical protein